MFPQEHPTTLNDHHMNPVDPPRPPTGMLGTPAFYPGNWRETTHNKDWHGTIFVIHVMFQRSQTHSGKINPDHQLFCIERDLDNGRDLQILRRILDMQALKSHFQTLLQNQDPKKWSRDPGICGVLYGEHSKTIQRHSDNMQSEFRVHSKTLREHSANPST